MADEIEVNLQFGPGQGKLSITTNPCNCTVGDVKDFVASTLVHREELFSDAGRRFRHGDTDEDELARPTKHRRLTRVNPIPRKDLGFIFNGRQLRDEDTLASLGPRFFAYANIIVWRKTKPYPVFPSDLRTELYEVLKYIIASTERINKAQDDYPPGETETWIRATNAMLDCTLTFLSPFVPEENTGKTFAIIDPNTERIMYSFKIWHLGQGIFRAQGKVRSFIDWLIYAPETAFFHLQWAELEAGEMFPEHRLNHILSFDAHTRSQHFKNADDLLQYIAGLTGVDIEIVRAVMLQYDRLNKFPDYQRQLARVGQYRKGGRDITVSLDYLRRKKMIPHWPPPGAAYWRRKKEVQPSQPRKRKRDDLVEDL